MKIIIDEEGYLIIDSVKTEIKDLNAELLENIVIVLLDEKCEIEVKKDNPLGNFFKQLKEDTSEESDLYKTVHEYRLKKNRLKEELKQLDLTYENEQ